MRRASWLFLSAALVSLAAPVRAHAQRAPDELSRFRNREAAIWESVKNKEMDPIRKVFDRDYVAVYDYGIVGLSGEIDGMQKVTLRSYQLSDSRLHHIDNVTVAHVYKVVIDGESDGQSISGNYNALTIWHRSGNTWSVQAHSDVKAR